jgi:glycosyltransferase involved in cell wall biosynthesis
MRVLLVNKAYPPVIGGIERHVQSLAQGLANRGIEVQVLVCNQGMRREVIRKGSLAVVKVPSPGTVASMHLGPSTPLWFRRLRVDLIHVHLPYPMADLCTWLTRPRIPVLATYHSDIVRQRFLLHFYGPLRDWFLKRVDRILVTSAPIRENSTVLRPVEHKCRVVPLGVNLERLAPPPELQNRIKGIRASDDKPMVLFIGRLVKYKGLEYLLRAMVGVRASLHVVGEGPMRRALERICHDLQLDDTAHFAGIVTDDDLTVYLHACDLLVLPSIGNNEAFGLVQLEAMACGKPVVSTNLPTGVPYVNLHGETGIVVPPRDSEALRSAILELLRNPDRRETMGRRGRERVEQFFTADQMVENVLRNYQEVLEEWRKRGLPTAENTPG